MTDFYQKIVDMQGTLEDIARKIPGFKGYLERDDRRNADELLRNHIVRLLEEQRGEFTRLQQRLVQSGGLKYMERVQNIDTQLSTFIDRVRTAARGYSGVFDAIKVDADGLSRLYKFDNTLLAYNDQLATGLRQFDTAIGSGEGNLDGVLTQLDQLVLDANNTFKERSDALLGLQESV